MKDNVRDRSRHVTGWCGERPEAVEFATLEWVDGFNHQRLLELLGNIPPAKAEARYPVQIAGQAVAA